MARRLCADTLPERTAYPEGPLSNEIVGPLSIAVRLSPRIWTVVVYSHYVSQCRCHSTGTSQVRMSLRAAGCREVFLYTHEENERVLAVYQAAGYRSDGSVRESVLRPMGVHMNTAFSNVARGDERPLLTQAASYFFGIRAISLSVIRRGDSGGLPRRERSPHDSHAGAGPSIAVGRAARSEQVRRIDAQKA
jgi:hypothetical protein